MRHEYAIGPIVGHGTSKGFARSHAEAIAARCAEALIVGTWLFPAPEGSEWVAIGAIPTRDGVWATVVLSPDGLRTLDSGFSDRGGAIWSIAINAARMCVSANTDMPQLDQLQRWLAKALGDEGQAVTERVMLARRAHAYRLHARALAEGKGDAEAHRLMCEAL